MKKRILFRVDGNTNIGLGHIVRSIALAQMLEKHFSISFFCKEIPNSIAKEIVALGYKLFVIQDESTFFEHLNKQTIVVLDHYALDSNYQKSIKAIGCKLVCIDDVPDKIFYADLIINHAPHTEPSDYMVQTYTQFAVGLDYVLLRPIFLELAQKGISSQKKDEGKVLVCFGGSDSKNLTQRTVEILKLDKRYQVINIIVGSAYQHIDNLIKAITGDDRFKVFTGINELKMAELMVSSGLAIVPASGILQEALALGCKVISGIYAENQRNIFDQYKLLNAFESAEEFSKRHIETALHNVLNGAFSEGSVQIDGNSGERLLKYFKLFLVEEETVLRRIEHTDLLKTFEWANDLSIRKFSFNTSPINFETHQNWFIKKLTDQNCFYYIGEINNQVFGSLRFDVDENAATISYLIDSKFQNKGLGTILLRKGLELFISNSNHEVELVQGEVLMNNIASIKVFTRLGYTMAKDKEERLLKFAKVIRNN